MIKGIADALFLLNSKKHIIQINAIVINGTNQILLHSFLNPEEKNHTFQSLHYLKQRKIVKTTTYKYEKKKRKPKT